MNISSAKSVFLSHSRFEISLFILIVSSIGSLVQISGGSWDVTSHILQEPESFFTPSHTMLYTGVGLISLSALLGCILMRSQEIKNTSLAGAFKLLVIGSLSSVIAGPSDFLWHNTFGFDGLLSPSHVILVTGMLVNSVAVFMGLYRLMSYLPKRKRLIQFFLIPSLTSLWYTSIWYTFMFVLPFSDSDFFNFNLDSYSATIIASISLPLINSIIFLSSSRALNNGFGSGFVIASLLLVINIFANIIPAKGLLSPVLPWYIVTILSASLLSDIILNSRLFKNELKFKYNKLAVGGIMGSVFYFFNYPMITWTYGNALNANLDSINGVLPTFLNTLVPLSFFTIAIGAVMGVIGSLIFSKIEPHWFDPKFQSKKVSFAENTG